MSTTVSIIGNATRDPELRYTPSGQAVVNLGVAVNTRRKEGDEWVDGEPQFYNVSGWRDLAENVAESISKGDRVMVIGKLQYRAWEDDEGNKRNAVSITADEIGPALRWASATITRNERGAGGGRPAAPVSRPIFEDEEPF